MTESIADEVMQLEDYLEQGGVLTSPGNVSPRYRGELMRLMASFVDSELAGSAGFADVINTGPGIKERISASRITLEKLDHAERVLTIMGEFGANTSRYFDHHPWNERVSRDTDIGTSRHGKDMRLSVFYYPLEGWTDAVVMNVLMGTAVAVQLDEYVKISYQPLAEIFRQIKPRERRHTELGIEGLRKLLESSENNPVVESSIAYWRPRVELSFGAANSTRFEALKRFGLRHTPNDMLKEQWANDVSACLSDLGLH